MLEWLKANVVSHLTRAGLLYGSLIFVATFVVTTAIVFLIVVKLPEDYFHPSNERRFWVNQHPALRLFGLILKNLCGVVLVCAGIVMALPGVPGPGLLTVLLGVMLLDFPGKRALELRLVSQSHVRRELDRIRKKFDKPPLLLD